MPNISKTLTTRFLALNKRANPTENAHNFFLVNDNSIIFKKTLTPYHGILNHNLFHTIMWKKFYMMKYFITNKMIL
jgi:hypothetical protein